MARVSKPDLFVCSWLTRPRLLGTGGRSGAPRLLAEVHPTKGDEMFQRTKSTLPAADEALPGRPERPFRLSERHKALDAPLVTEEVPEGYEVALFGLGCFWGAEEIFWQVPGVWSTSVGYTGGTTPNPSYEEVCSGRTGHTEAVRVVYDPARVSYADLVATFYEVHDPTQGMRQGNDRGTQYRSAIYVTSPEQEMVARLVTERYQPELTKRGYGQITTEIKPEQEYFYAEDHHQQYLLKNPFGYRCHSATGVPCPR
jgi:peptide-methionine (S)-S-oxide reductase